MQTGPVPLGGNLKKREYVGGDPPLSPSSHLSYPHLPVGVNNESHRLGASILGSYTWERSHFVWLEGCGKLEECVGAGLLLRQSREGRERTALETPWFLSTTSTEAPSKAK